MVMSVLVFVCVFAWLLATLCARALVVVIALASGSVFVHIHNFFIINYINILELT